MPVFSTEQRDAIDSRGENLLVSAAAGSGKTAVLVERILTLLKEGASLDGMLIVTYTRAAAAQMRERISAALSAQGDTPHLRAQRALITRAQIKTLHSFCTWLLRQNFLKADLSPAFRVGGDMQLAPLRSRVLDEALDEALLRDEAALLRLCRVDQLGELVLRVCAFLNCQVDPAAFAAALPGQYRALWKDFPASPHAQLLDARRKQLVDEADGLLAQALRLCELPGGPAQYLGVLSADRASLRTTPEFGRLPGGKAECDENLREAVRALREQAKKTVEKLTALPVADADAIERMAQMQQSVEALLRLCTAFSEQYAAARLEAGYLDYSDLEHRTLHALRDGDVRAGLQGQFSHIFVDEYQDANAVQEAIITAIARGDNRFMVGDVKQSIYRFRMADPDIFLATAKQFAKGEGGRRIDLNRNYRSVPAVLDAVNCIFSPIMQGGQAEIEYDEQAMLRPGRTDAHGEPVDVLLLECPLRGDPDDPASEYSSAEKEAIAVAGLVREQIGTPIPDGKGGTRPARPGDIAILLRATRSTAPLYMRALEEAGIPALADVGGALFTTPEVAVFVDLLRAIDNRRRDLPLLAAMRMAGGFSSAHLAQIRADHLEGSFFEAAQAARECRPFLDRLLAWREQARHMPLTDFLHRLLDETGHEQTVRLSPRGEARAANLRALCAMATRMPGGTLGDFLAAISLIEQAGDTDTAQLPSDDQDAVRLMSVHKSKGLEFPIVIGAGLGRAFQKMDSRDPLLLSRELGIAPRFCDETVSVTANTPAREAIALRVSQQSLAEEMRILYVLMTRACDRLILTAALPSIEKAAARWACRPPSLHTASCFMDWVGGVLIRHPDGGVLRDAFPGFVDQQPHPARFHITCAVGEAPPAQQDEEISLAQALQQPGNGLAQSLRERLTFIYPSADPLPQKTSVSARLRSEVRIDRPGALPAFLSERGDVPAAQRGTVAHAAMRALNFAALAKLPVQEIPAVINAQIQGMIERALLTAAQAQTLPVQGMAGFLAGDAGQQMLRAATLYREQPFNLRLDDRRLMQGIIDLCYLDADGRWVVLDYKTDRRGLTPPEIDARHGSQLRLYAHALEALTGKGVAACAVIALADGGRTIPVPLTEAIE